MPFNIVDGIVTVRGEDGYLVQIGKEGRLHITNATPLAIVGYNNIFKQIYKAIEGYQYELDYYIIPTGKKMLISKIRMTSGGGHNSAGLYLCPDGVYTPALEDDSMIVGAYFNSELVEVDIDKEYTGDGTTAICLKLTRRDKGKEWVGADWSGIVEE